MKLQMRIVLFSQTEVIVNFKNHQMKKYSVLLFLLLLVFSIDF
jgi:hypothetical protein